MDIAAGVATDSDGAGNTPAPRLSLGIPYDFDGNGGISRAETIAAIRDYFGGNITRAQAIAVIRLYFSAPTGPGPGPSDDCIQTVSSDGTLNGQWASGCDSETRSGSHARYYTFTLDASSQVTIRLESGAANTHLYLRREDATSGTALHENDDHEGSTSVSQIQETLAADTYTVEATTYAAGSTGSFTLSISGLSGTTPTDPALLRYAAEKAGGPGAIYVDDINQLVGPVVGPAPGHRYSRSSLGDDDGMVPLYALQDPSVALRKRLLPVAHRARQPEETHGTDINRREHRGSARLHQHARCCPAGSSNCTGPPTWKPAPTGSSSWWSAPSRSWV